jgi:hypothetical protein
VIDPALLLRVFRERLLHEHVKRKLVRGQTVKQEGQRVRASQADLGAVKQVRIDASLRDFADFRVLEADITTSLD